MLSTDCGARRMSALFRYFLLTANTIAAFGSVVLIGSGDRLANAIGLLCGAACVLGQLRAGAKSNEGSPELDGMDTFAVILAILMALIGMVGIFGSKPPGVILGWTFTTVGVIDSAVIGSRLRSRKKFRPPE